MEPRRNWSTSEVQEALALYLVTDFGRFHRLNPDVIRLASRLTRTPSAVALKLSNLAALDESLPQKGMANASATDRAVWAEFLANPTAVEAAYHAQTPEPGFADIGFAEAPNAFDHLGGQTARLTNQRVGQSLFRRIILTNYQNRCALTGAEDPRLLSASHILPWSSAPQHRMWPTNGICLNALHDRAFDRHLISFDDNLTMLVSKHLPPSAQNLLRQGVTGTLQSPKRFAPDPAFLTAHRQQFHALAA